ncbi:MAG: patatin-like phospholipase family protein [Bacteroidetes bacterium]|nr:patatin-like phospholipase family protein [Bacteroidota bacterium]
MEDKFKILSLDGGGAKGIYTLGILYEIEAYLEKNLNKNLQQYFDLFYGTSTGSIIASMICLGYKVDMIKKKYINMLPSIMSPLRKKIRSAELRKYLEKEFENKDFYSFPKPIGIVATNLTKNRQIIFKTNVSQALGSQSTFKPGFGCSIAEAIEASCAAYPLYFHLKNITNEQINAELVDGGYVANNPTLFAIIEARKAFKKELNQIYVLNIGTGTFIEKRGIVGKLIKRFNWISYMSNIFQANSQAFDDILTYLFDDVNKLRINDTTTNESLATSLLEYDKDKLEKIFSFGRETFSKFESEIKNFLT